MTPSHLLRPPSRTTLRPASVLCPLSSVLCLPAFWVLCVLCALCVPASALSPLSPGQAEALNAGVHGLFGCEGCHAEGTADRIPRVTIPEVCGDCHPRQLADYLQSVHWDEGRAHTVCVDCHGVHDLLPVRNPHSRAFRSLVCGSCHPGPFEQFQRGPHAPAMAAAGALACASCHGNHLVRHPTVSIVEPGCLSCHDRSTDRFAFGQWAGGRFDALRDTLSAVAAGVDSARNAGLIVRRADGALNEAGGALAEARTVWHALDRGAIDRAADRVLERAGASRKETGSAFASRDRRRAGLAAAWVFILANVFLLYLKKRRVDRAFEPPAARPTRTG